MPDVGKANWFHESVFGWEVTRAPGIGGDHGHCGLFLDSKGNRLGVWSRS